MTAQVPFSSLLSAFLFITVAAGQPPTKFRNPLFSSQDPSVAYSAGIYYYCDSDGDHIRIRSSRVLSALGQQRPRIVWTASKRGWDGHANVWAPELHQIAGVWYLYFAADYRTDGRHRLYVLVGGQDPFGPYSEGDTGAADGQLIESTDRWAIDPHVFTGVDGRL